MTYEQSMIGIFVIFSHHRPDYQHSIVKISDTKIRFRGNILPILLIFNSI